MFIRMLARGEDLRSRIEHMNYKTSRVPWLITYDGK